MLLWEMISPLSGTNGQHAVKAVVPTKCRLPFDKRCVAATKTGRRCKAKIHGESEFCYFHDPEMAQARQLQLAKARKSRRTKLMQLPGGYLRKLTSRRAVGQAMDRLYRDILYATITPEMGRVLFDILCRFMESDIPAFDNENSNSWHRTKAHRLRPKLSELLTRAERRAWKRAVENAPAKFLVPDKHRKPVSRVPSSTSGNPSKAEPGPARRPVLTAAS